MEREEIEEGDNRREAAIASSASLQHNFKPKNGLSEAQLSKFQELHKRRLQIKAKSKVNKRAKGVGKDKSHWKASKANDCTNEVPSRSIEDSITPQILSNELGNTMSAVEHNVAGNLAAKKRQKLHWGLQLLDLDNCETRDGVVQNHIIYRDSQPTTMVT